MGSLRLSNNQNLNQSGFSGYGSLITVSRKTDDNVFPGEIMGALMGVTGPNIRTNVIPSYHMRSANRFQSFSPGLRDGGEIAAAVNWLPGGNATQGRYASEWSLLRQAYLNSNDLTRIRVLAPDPDMHLWSFDGFLTQLGPVSYQPEAIMSGQCGWKIVGRPELVTPIVYNVTGDTTKTVSLSSVSNVGSSDANSRAATIRLPVSFDQSGDGSSVTTAVYSLSGVAQTSPAALSLGTVAVTGSATAWSVAIPGLTTAIPSSGTFTDNTSHITVPTTGTTAGELFARLYIPGEYELWFDYGPVADDISDALSVTTGASDFNSAYQANGNRCFLAIYGADTLF